MVNVTAPQMAIRYSFKFSQERHELQAELLFGFRAGGKLGFGEKRVDGFGRARNVIRAGHLHLKAADHILAIAGRAEQLAQIGLAEEQRLGGVRIGEGADQREFGVHRENIAREENLFADLPVHTRDQIGAGDGGGAQMLELAFLVVRHVDLRADLEEFGGFHREAREEIVLVARVLIGSAEPLPDHLLAHAGDLADLVAVVRRNRLRDRNFVMRHHPELLSRGGRGEKQAAIEGEQHSQKAERSRDARDGEHAAAAVAQGVLQQERNVLKH